MAQKIVFVFSILCLVLLSQSCEKGSPTSSLDKPLFTQLNPKELGIDFENNLVYDSEFNVYTYRNFYNGGGVALGDINQDGLTDIYFIGNMEDNHLYLNKGDFQFEDITEKAGVACKNVWSTGASLTDVNGDGLLDIYVCKSGNPEGENRHNELFINNGDLTFTEKAEEYGIADKGFSTHAAFFDMDKDGDLDCYLLNNSFRPIGAFDLRKNQRNERDPEGGNKLYRNDEGTFTDISEEANIYGSVIGFGLGVTVGDLNRDGWQDIYVSNDFFERDYLYINQKDGTFKECLEEQVREISAASMGADMADINNDGYPEIFVTDMLPEDDERIKTKTTFENWDKYQINVKNGYYHQFTRNVLQLNNGNGTFSEIGRLAGVNATDWSWGALIIDLDNDGWKDIFVANGIYQDLTDQDFINYIANPRTVRKVIRKDSVDFKHLIDVIPVNPIPNYAFKNNQDLTFTNVAEEWGLGTPGHSNGSAYGDLDNDGDLDMVINNVNAEPFIYRNEARQLLPDRHYLMFDLKGEGKNTYALGTQVSIYHQGKEYFAEQMPMRGFESTIDHRLHIGLGEIETVDSVIVNWPNGTRTLLQKVNTDQTLILSQEEGQPFTPKHSEKEKRLLAEISETFPLQHVHQENSFIDFDRDRLIYHMLSADGPHMCKGDMNGDGLEDLYVVGSKDQAAAMYVQTEAGSFEQVNQDIFEQEKASEETDCACFDADNDGDMDLYVTSGGNEYPSSAVALKDKLYLNEGDGTLTKSPQSLPTFQYESSSTVVPGDYDQDGDNDLFIGVRLKPFLYGVPANGYLLENDGKGIFKNVTETIAPDLVGVGMITDAAWFDMDQDDDLDLIVVGDWMPVTVLEQQQGVFKKVETPSLAYSNGFWNCIRLADLDQDGDMDFVIGNHGLNTRFRASTDEPVTMLINDFDKNGSAEQVISVFNKGTSYPLALRHDLVMQMPILKKKYLKYEAYKNQQVSDIFTAEQLVNAVELTVYDTKTSILENKGKGKFEFHPLPMEAQFSPTFGLLVKDLDEDGYQDIILAGNFHRAKPEVGMYDASYGLMLKGKGEFDFDIVPREKSGFTVTGEAREMLPFSLNGENLILVAMNDEKLKVFKINE
ncbi:MAG: VCBS repeat-containing protein [Bacteroidota bacterium]